MHTQKEFIYRNRFLFTTCLIILAAELYVGPPLNVPLNDDWAYALSVKNLYETGDFSIGNWPAMTLVAHVIWGWLFTVVLGYSFTTLHIAGLVVSLIGIYFLYKIILSLNQNHIQASIGSIIFYFNPIAFNIGHSFMTDLSFTTALLICVWYAARYFQTRRILYLVLFFCFSAILVFVRQYGLIVPLAFVIISLTYQKFRNLHLLYMGLLFALLFLAYKVYEAHLSQILPSTASYKFSGNLPINSQLFSTLVERFLVRYKGILYHMLWYTFPFALFAMPALFSALSRIKIILSLALSGFIIIQLYAPNELTFSNIFFDTNLGTPTFYQDIFGTCVGYGHGNSGYFDAKIVPYKYFGMIASLWLWLMALVSWIEKRKLISPLQLFASITCALYIIMILLTETYFDRYHLPLICLVLVLVGKYAVLQKYSVLPALLAIMAFAYISLKATRDYYDLKTHVATAINDLRKEGVSENRINAGVETFMYQSSGSADFSEFGKLSNFDYLIQYKPEPDFEPYRVYYFKNRIRFTKDSIVVFKKKTAQ